MGEPNSIKSEFQIKFAEHVKIRSEHTGVPEEILAKIRITQLDTYSYSKDGSDPIKYWVDRYKREGKQTKYDTGWWVYAFNRDVHYAREKNIPINLPTEFNHNLPFAYDGGYIILDDDGNLQIMVSAQPNIKSDAFGDMHDLARGTIESRTGKKLSEFAGAQRCYVIHTYNKISEKIESLIVPITSFNKENTQQYLGSQVLLDWPDVWESRCEVGAGGTITDVTEKHVSNAAKITLSQIASAEEMYSKSLAREWLLNKEDLSVRFVTGTLISEWANMTVGYTQTSDGVNLIELLRKQLADPNVEHTEAIREYLRKSMMLKASGNKDLLKED